MDLIYCVIIVVLSLQLPGLFLKGKDLSYLPAMRSLILYHLLFSVFYYFFTRNGGGDAWGYWKISRVMSSAEFMSSITEGEGTAFMEALNYIPASVLGMGYFVNSLFYGLLGSIGLCCFFVVALRTVPYNSFVAGFKLFPLIFYLPNLHFWSGGVGKDTILFLCIGLFTYALLMPLQRLFLLIVALGLSFAIRPHVTLILLVGFGIAYMFTRKMAMSRRIIFVFILAGLSVYILPKVMEFVKLEDLSLTSISQRGEGQAELLKGKSGSSVDISGYPLPLKMFTFLYRPLFFDAHSITSVLASLENVVLLYLSFLVFRRFPVKAYRAAPYLIQGMVLVLIIATFLFSQTLGNLGIIIRMKNMFMPGFLLFILWALSFQNYYLVKNKS